MDRGFFFGSFFSFYSKDSGTETQEQNEKAAADSVFAGGFPNSLIRSFPGLSVFRKDQFLFFHLVFIRLSMPFNFFEPPFPKCIPPHLAKIALFKTKKLWTKAIMKALFRFVRKWVSKCPAKTGKDIQEPRRKKSAEGKMLRKPEDLIMG